MPRHTRDARTDYPAAWRLLPEHLVRMLPEGVPLPTGYWPWVGCDRLEIVSDQSFQPKLGAQIAPVLEKRNPMPHMHSHFRSQYKPDDPACGFLPAETALESPQCEKFLEEWVDSISSSSEGTCEDSCRFRCPSFSLLRLFSWQKIARKLANH
eukprot:SAG31_NODE_1386_length_8574_cov_2.055037_1_plen_153_part_00